MNSLKKALVVSAALWAGSALADVDGHWQQIPESGWQTNLPGVDSSWMIPAAQWESELPPAYAGEIGFPGLGDWNIGVEPPRRGDDEVRCMAIGCEEGGGGSERIITIGDCRKGPC